MTNHNACCITKKIINHHDPIGLLAGGAPDDEYEMEIREINALLGNNYEVHNLAKEIREIFIKKFDVYLAGEIEKYEKIAIDLLHR